MVRIRNWIGHNEVQTIESQEYAKLTCLAHKSVYGLAVAVTQLESDEKLENDFKNTVKIIQELIGDTETCRSKHCKKSYEKVIELLPEYPIFSCPLFTYQ